MNNSRWKCPRCGSLDVQIALPAWYRETTAYALEPVSVDEEAEPLYWYCGACNSSDDGSPEEAAC